MCADFFNTLDYSHMIYYYCLRMNFVLFGKVFKFYYTLIFFN